MRRLPFTKPLCVLILFYLGFPFFSFSQNKVLDSLYNLLNSNPQADTSKVLVLVEIATTEYVTNPDKAFQLAEEALTISKKINYIRGEGYSYGAMGRINWSKGNFDEASTFAYKMIAIFEKLGTRKDLSRSYYFLGQIFHQWQDFEKTKNNYLKALALNEASGNQILKGYILNSLGSLYLDVEKYDSALIYYKNSLQIRLQINDDQGVSQSYNNIGLVYSRQKKYQQAIEYFNKSLPITKKLNNKVRLAITTRGLGETYLALKDFAKAEGLLLDALAQMNKLGDKMILLEINETLEKLEEQRSDYKKALFYERQKRLLQDSMFNDQKSQQLTEMTVKYETEKKEKEIQLLEQENRIQALWRNILIAGFVLLLFVFVLVYKLQQYKARKNLANFNLQIDLLTSQNQELAKKYKHILTENSESIAESQDQKLLKKALEVVEQNISDSLFGVEKMAQEMGMSRATLSKKLKSTTGFSPSELIRTIRLKRAANLLQNNADSVTQIGFAVGFEDQSYFTKSFRKQFGVTPSEFSSKRDLIS
jgi:AraC-like DNA-binding protein